MPAKSPPRGPRAGVFFFYVSLILLMALSVALAKTLRDKRCAGNSLCAVPGSTQASVADPFRSGVSGAIMGDDSRAQDEESAELMRHAAARNAAGVMGPDPCAVGSSKIVGAFVAPVAEVADPHAIAQLARDRIQTIGADIGQGDSATLAAHRAAPEPQGGAAPRTLGGFWGQVMSARQT